MGHGSNSPKFYASPICLKAFSRRGITDVEGFFMDLALGKRDAGQRDGPGNQGATAHEALQEENADLKARVEAQAQEIEQLRNDKTRLANEVDSMRSRLVPHSTSFVIVDCHPHPL